MDDYIGKHRVGWKMVLVFGLGIPLFGFGCWLVFNDAAYQDAVTTGRRSLLDAVPQPVMQVLMTAMFGLSVAAVPLKLSAVFGGRTSFTITADGVHSYPLLRKPAVMAWNEMTSGFYLNDMLIFRGRGEGGKTRSVSISLIGHDRAAVAAVIARYRPDIAEQV